MVTRISVITPLIRGLMFIDDRLCRMPDDANMIRRDTPMRAMPLLIRYTRYSRVDYAIAFISALLKISFIVISFFIYFITLFFYCLYAYAEA